MGCAGSCSRKARNTDNPPTPESKTPIKPCAVLWVEEGMFWASVKLTLTGGAIFERLRLMIASLDKSAKERAHGQVTLQPLRMPLHSQAERVVGELEAFQNAIWCKSGGL
jgi:hypothetical protein